MWGSGWLHQLKRATYGLGGFVKNGLGAVIDLASTDWGSAGLGTDYNKMISGLGNFLGGAKEVTGPVGNTIAWTMQTDRELYNYVSRGISTGFTVASLTDSPAWQQQTGHHPAGSWSWTGAKNGFDVIWDPNTWKKAWAIAKTRSPGQALVLSGTHDILDPNEVQDYSRGFWFNLLSGSTDAVLSLEFDPLGKAGQAVKVTGANRLTRSLPSKLSAMGESPEIARAEVPSNTRALPAGGTTPDWEFANGSPKPPQGPPKRGGPLDTSGPVRSPNLPGPTPIGVGPKPNWEFGQRPPPKVVPGEVVPSQAEQYSQRLGHYISGEKSPIRRTLEWADSKVAQYKDPALAAKAIEKHPMLQNSPVGGLIATMLANSNWGEKELIMKVSLGDPEAYSQLAARRGAIGEDLAGKREDLAKLLQQSADMRDDLIKSELPSDVHPGMPEAMDKALNDERIQTLEAEIGALEKRESWINDVIGRADREGDPGIRSSLIHSVPKGGGYGALSRSVADARYAIDRAAQRGGINELWHYYNAYNTPIRILATTASRTTGAASHFFVDKRPGAYVNINDPEGWRNLDFMLRRVKGFSSERRNALVGEYMGATSEGPKIRAIMAAEREAIRHIAARNGLAPDEIDPIINQFMTQRQAAKAMLRNRAYSGTLDEHGRRIDFVDEENVPTSVEPLLKTQLADQFPLANVDTIQTAIARHKWSIRALNRITNPRTYNQPDAVNGFVANAFKAKDIAVSASDILSGWWKASALMRMGYTIRMLTDDGLAYVAKLGAMGALHNLAMGTGHTGSNLARYLAANKAAFKSGDLASELEKMAPKKRLGEADVNIPLDKIQRFKRNPEKIIERFPNQSVTAQGVFGGPKAQRDFWRGLSSEGRDILMQSEDELLRGMRREMAQQLYNPGDVGYMEAWTRALNLQLGQDPMARRLLAGESEENVIKWLRSSTAGRAYARDIPFRSADPERWVSNIATMVDHYAPTAEIRQAALDNKVTQKLLKTATKGQAAPQIHGAMLSYNMGQSAAAAALVDYRNAFFKHFSTIPTDALVRHPLTASLYETRLRDLVQRWDRAGGEINNDTIRVFESQARKHAVKETKKVIFDLTQHSNAAHVFRFVAPFYAPWEETLKRWGRLAYGNPQVLFRGNDIWQGFNKIYGTHLEDSNGKPIKGFTGLNADNQLITFRVPPSIAKHIPGLGQMPVTQIPKASLNLTLQGDPWWLPGFGPFVQIPVSELVKDKPDVYQHLKFLLPYGPQSVANLVMPNTLKRFEQFNNDDDASYSTTKIRIYQTRYTDWVRNGRHGPEPLPNDNENVKYAQWLHGIQWAASMFLPVNPRFHTPYKFYIDKYRQLEADSNRATEYRANAKAYSDFKQAHPGQYVPREQFGAQSARDAFIKMYPDFFMFADSVSKNNAGVPASIEALKASQKYSKLISENPDLAPVVLGPNAPEGGKFDPAVYQYQFGQKLGQTGKHYRDRQTVADFAHQALASEGWRQYDQIMNVLRADLGSMGLRSFAQNGAEGLKRAKDALLGNLAKTNPSWYEDYISYSAPAKIASTVTGLQHIAKDPALNNRSDIVALNQYLAGREVFQRALAQRKASGGAGSLTANTNQDLMAKWIAFRDSVAESDTVFSQNIFDRYLANDLQLTAVGV